MPAQYCAGFFLSRAFGDIGKTFLQDFLQEILSELRNLEDGALNKKRYMNFE
jgi:hypothetical protein